jgi:putative spermidine/putrescine transport system ATP-binding protein
MSSVTLENINKQYNGVDVLKNINMTIEDGKFVTLLGPSGCGKSTILRVITGLVKQDQGTLYLDEKNMNDVPTKGRSVGMVFQSYALFPNLNVFENVAFGLKVKKRSKEEIQSAVQKMLDLVGLSEKKNAFPHELSGGQQQRVALARALIVRPKVLLLDEPLSALDAQIRKHLQIQLRNIQQELNMTMVLVTHDQEEAMNVSDRIFVMNKGRIEQEGTPFEIYTKPKTEFIAGFIGSYNVFTKQELEFMIQKKVNNQASKFAIRPEAIRIQPMENSYVIHAKAGKSVMTGNIIKTQFEYNETTFSIEQIHHHAKPFEESKDYQLFIEKEDVIPLS